MIQRKQTLYLLASGLLMLIPIFLPMLVLTDGTSLYSFGSTGFATAGGEIVSPSWALLGLNVLVILLSLVTIFLFNNRVLQMRITVFSLILKFGFYGLGVFYCYSFNNQPDLMSNMGIRLPLAIPLICMILDYLAHRAIAIDEQTIRYMHRLR